MRQVIECMISCDLCGLTDLKVYVDERKEDQPLMDWMNNVFLPTIGTAHASLKPDCHPDKLKNAKIPCTDKGVGFKP